MTPYRRALGTAWASCPPPVRAFHAQSGRYVGQISVKRPKNPFLRLIGWAAGFPSSVMNKPFVLTKTAQGDREVWTRKIAHHRMTSTQWCEDGLLAERMGPLTAITRLDVKDDAIQMTLVAWRLLGCPMPVWLGPRISTRESAQGQNYCFDVSVGVPVFASTLVRYSGHLVTGTPDDALASCRDASSA